MTPSPPPPEAPHSGFISNALMTEAESPSQLEVYLVACHCEPGRIGIFCLAAEPSRVPAEASRTSTRVSLTLLHTLEPLGWHQAAFCAHRRCRWSPPWQCERTYGRPLRRLRGCIRKRACSPECVCFKIEAAPSSLSAAVSRSEEAAYSLVPTFLRAPTENNGVSHLLPCLLRRLG
jgi:hypothetical protein